MRRVHGSFGHHCGNDYGLGCPTGYAGFGLGENVLAPEPVPIPLAPVGVSKGINLQSAEDIAVSVIDKYGISKVGDLLSKGEAATQSVSATSREKLMFFGAGVLLGLWRSRK